MNTSSVAGFWKIKSSLVRSNDGSWLDDPASGGTLAFSHGNQFCIFFRSTQGTWGYSGTFAVDGKKMFMTIDACSAQDVEGETLEREIEFKNADELIYRGVEFHTGRPFEAVVKRVNES